MVRRRSNEEVELNVASMLDMAFQLLAFFIMTFKPPPNECAIQLRMPPPQQAIGIGQSEAGDNPDKDPSTVKPVITLSIQLESRSDGSLGPIQVGVLSKTQMSNVTIDKLDKELATTYFNGSLGFEQVLIMAAPDLHWSEVMRVVDICAKQRLPDGKLPRLNFRSMGHRAPSA